jgi:hypothetical protein
MDTFDVCELQPDSDSPGLWIGFRTGADRAKAMALFRVDEDSSKSLSECLADREAIARLERRALGLNGPDTLCPPGNIEAEPAENVASGNTRPGHPRFYELLKRMEKVHAAKNHDYSGTLDPLRNLRQCGDAGVEPWVGVVVRLTDKMDRLKTFAAKREFRVKDESVADTFIDMANYALLGLILYEESESKKRVRTRATMDTEELRRHIAALEENMRGSGVV